MIFKIFSIYSLQLPYSVVNRYQFQCFNVSSFSEDSVFLTFENATYIDYARSSRFHFAEIRGFLTQII